LGIGKPKVLGLGATRLGPVRIYTDLPIPDRLAQVNFVVLWLVASATANFVVRGPRNHLQGSSMNNKLTDYYEKAFSQAGEGGSIYKPMTVLERAGHDRKAALLAKLPLPDLAQATVVDYGVGSWGFGCVFPKLKDCQRAIGIDVSQTAADQSHRISVADPALAGKEMSFFTSDGYDIALPDSSADVVFAGECIEHIEDTEAFLAELWRILKPNGIVIFTTPNERPGLYRKLGLKWAMGLEHVALMDSETLLKKIKKCFLLEVTKGYTSTITPEADLLIDDTSFASEVAKMCEDSFDQASGLIVMARKTDPIDFQLEKVRHVIVESESAVGVPDHRDLSLYGETLGRMAIGTDSHLLIPVPDRALRCQLILWSHPWSGAAKISLANHEIEIDLYSQDSGCVRVTLDTLQLADSTTIRIDWLGSRDPRSRGEEVIFFRAVYACGPDALHL
jgi:SAM-dependent methyltransferase